MTVLTLYKNYNAGEKQDLSTQRETDDADKYTFPDIPERLEMLASSAPVIFYQTDDNQIKAERGVPVIKVKFSIANKSFFDTCV